MSELFRKYNVTGPRYTSYPTVPYWETTPGTDEWLQSVAQGLLDSGASGAGAAIYVHVPFCQSLCTYCGCNTRITRKVDVGQPYVRTVLAEWKLYRERLRGLGVAEIPLSELHLGGGTPTFLSAGELEELVSGLLKGTRLAASHEFSIEADPRVTTEAHLETLARLGFRRLSLGIQDFDEKVQEAVHRVQSVEQVRQVTDCARGLGFTSVNYDLIYGLPFQTKASVKSTVEAVMALRPDRIAYYGYAHVPWIKPSQRRFTEADLPDGNAKRELYELGRGLLEQAGYAEVGMD
ncbi:MAG: coproporphyrinogen dehydrogenase, partial [Deltaproteobacteria bacterium]|nr:coproporphyrinogen dehydrogenase [Deltaproteobacteria bacterium]